MDTNKTIGEALKEERIRLNLTQEEMCKGIVTRSFYAKVERGERQIGSEPLARILFKHDIDVETFFHKIELRYGEPEKILANELSNRIGEAFNNHQIEAVEELKKEILRLKGNKTLKLRAIVADAYLKNKVSSLPQKYRKQIFEEFNNDSNWTDNVDALRLFANTMPIFNNEQLDFFVKNLLEKVSKRKDMSELETERIIIICDNFLLACYERKYDSSNIPAAINYIESIPATPHMLMYKISVLYDKALLEGNEQEKEEIRNFLTDCGYGNMIKNWQ